MIYFPDKGLPKKKGFKSQTDTLTVCPTIWECEEVGSTKNAYTKMFDLNPEIMFQTPKPLSFMERIVMIGRTR